MRAVFTSDLHVHPYRLESRDGGMDRLGDGLAALRETLDCAAREGCPWVFLGDLKQPRRSWPHDALTGAMAVIAQYPHVEKVMVKGNHDGEGDYGSGLRPFGPDALLVESPSEGVEIGGARFAVMPAMSGEVDVAAFVRGVPGDVKFLLGHGFIAGAKLGPDDYRAESGLTLEAMGMLGREPRFECAVFGDVHKGQSLSRGRKAPDWTPFSATAHLARHGVQSVRGAAAWRGEVFYCGSPYQQNWGERADGPKGALLVDFEAGEVKLLHVAAPRYVLEEWPDAPSAASVERALAAWSGNFVRLVAGPWARQGGHDTALQWLVETAAPRSYALEVVESRAVEQRAAVHGGMSGRELVEAYVAARPLDSVDAGHLVAAGAALMEDDA